MTDAMTYFRAGDDVPSYIIQRTPKSDDHRLGTIKFRVGCTVVTVGENIWLLPDNPEVEGGIITVDGAKSIAYSAGKKNVVIGAGCTVLGATGNV